MASLVHAQFLLRVEADSCLRQTPVKEGHSCFDTPGNHGHVCKRVIVQVRLLHLPDVFLKALHGEDCAMSCVR